LNLEPRIGIAWVSRFRKFEQRDEWKDCSSASH
jgi:hypothetical protein